MKPTFFATPEKFRAWLEKHHESASELLVGFYKRGSGTPSITWPESVDEALCFGWIDGVRRSLGDDAYTIRFTPRRATSIWSAVNVARVEALTKLGRMQPAGTRAFAARRPEKTGVYSFERAKAAVLTGAHEKQLRANAKAAAYFDAQAPWYRRAAIHWVVSAKREETREKRLATLIACSAAGRSIKPLERPAGTKKPARAVTAEATDEGSPAFDAVVKAMKREPGVEPPEASRRAFGSNGLKVNGKIFAMLVRGALVVKLPPERVRALVEGASGIAFDAGRGRVMKEWLEVRGREETWLALAREALGFVRAK